MSKKYIFDGALYTIHRALPGVTLVIVPLNSIIWIKVDHQCENKSELKLPYATISPYIKYRIVVEL